MKVPFHEVRRETLEVEHAAREAFEQTLSESRFVGGGAVSEFERAFAASCGATRAVGVGSGTAAITIGLLALGVEPGDEVITCANTCVPTVAAIALAGATPVLADIEPDTLMLSLDSVADAIGPRTRAVVPVHLYGRRVPMEPVLALAREHGLLVLEDAAQGHGLRPDGDAAAFSFYPTKNLAALGDAGALVTSDEAVAERARRLREYGWDEHRVSMLRAGQTRLDTLQAAVLLAKLPYLRRWNERRQTLAARYSAALRDGPTSPLPDANEDVHHLYVVRSADRDGLRLRLAHRGVETQSHYPLPIHRHPAWRALARPAVLAQSERAAAEVLSLPLYPQLTDDEADAVLDAVLAG